MLFALLLLTQSAQSGVVAQHSLSPDYVHADIAAACGDYVLRIQYRNAGGRNGHVTFVSINDRNVLGAVAALQARAANRYIERVDIMNCGFDRENPVIQGVMELSAAASQRDGLPPRVYFRFRREGSSWRISWE